MEPKPTLSLEGVVLASTFYREYRKKVFLYLMRNTQNQTQSEDITSTVFLKVTEVIAKGKYRDRNNPSSWIMQIAHNEMFNYFRTLIKTSKFNPDGFSSIPESSLDALSTLERFELHKDVRFLLDKLPKSQKEIIMLRIYAEMPFKEIKEMRGVTSGTLRVQYHKALVNLRNLIRDYGIEVNRSLKPG